MDQSVTIDGQRVLLNGEPVAEALGDFSVRVLAEAIVLHAKMVAEANDDDNPDGYWCQCRLVEAKKSVSSAPPLMVWPSRHSDALLAELIEKNAPIHVLENPNLFKPTELLSAGWTRDQMLQYGRVPERYGLTPPENKNHRCATVPFDMGPAACHTSPQKREEMTAERFSELFSQRFGPEKTPAPADLLVKAREYYPDNEGLLRMYADCRGYSCDQVAEAIDHAKRL